ncbi:MAG TPA: VOC family protein [Polyangiales bacterium]|nr:VOC family protein [Polyangiales bacterium]
MLTGFDHVTLVVQDLETAVAQYASLFGREPSWRGAHPELGTRAALFALENSLIELVGPAPDAEEAEALRTLLAERGEGLQALAFATEDAAACSRELRERGLRVTPPQAGVARGDDGSEREYATVELSARNTRGLSVFAVQRPDLARLRPQLSAAGAMPHALDHVVLRSADLDAAVRLYGTGLGLRLALDREFRGTRMLFFRIGGVTLEVVHDPSQGEADRLWGLAYRVRDIEAARLRLTAAGFAAGELRDGNKPGTRVFTLRSGTCGVPTLILLDPART